MDRKIRISARLWMNSLDALVTAAKQGAGIVRVPSWQVEADIAGGALQRLLRDHEPPPAPLHLLLGPSRLSQPKCRVFVDYLVEQWRVINPFGAQRASDSSR
jgi:DNA-binding transcriptional LysR family regulator